MTRRHAGIAAVVALLVAGGAFHRWWTGPERQIRAILDAVAAAMTHAEPDTGLQSLSAAAALQPHLALDVVVETPDTRIGGRHEVVAVAARVRAASPALRLRFFDPRVRLTGETSATLSATAEVITTNESGEDLVDVHQVVATVDKAGDRWVVSHARTMAGEERDE